MNRSSDYHSNHRMRLEMKRVSYTPRPTGPTDQGSITNLPGIKTTAQSEKTAQERRHLKLHKTQAKTCGIEPTQIPDSLGEHNRRQENNKQHEQLTKHGHEGGTTTTTRANKATHTKSSTLPPQRRVELYVGRQTTTRTKNKPNNNKGGRRMTPNEERQTVQCKLMREHRSTTTNRKNN